MRELERETPSEPELPAQFHRTELMLGAEGLRRLRNSCVMIVGLGAVGGYATEALARAGIGEFRLVDFDAIQESNLNRQLLATRLTLNLPKTEAARARIASIKPSSRATSRDALVNDATVDSLFQGEWSNPPDYVVDAIDSLGPKVALIAATLKRGIPMISSMGAALRFDAGLVSCGSLADATYCPLAAQVRERLRRAGVDPRDVKCVYSPEPIRQALRDGQERLKRVEPTIALPTPDAPRKGRARNTLGSLPTVVGIFGLRIAHEIILELAGSR